MQDAGFGSPATQERKVSWVHMYVYDFVMKTVMVVMKVVTITMIWWLWLWHIDSAINILKLYTIKPLKSKDRHQHLTTLHWSEDIWNISVHFYFSVVYNFKFFLHLLFRNTIAAFNHHIWLTCIHNFIIWPCNFLHSDLLTYSLSKCIISPWVVYVSIRTGFPDVDFDKIFKTGKITLKKFKEVPNFSENFRTLPMIFRKFSKI